MRILLLSDQPRDSRLGAWKVAFELHAALRQAGEACDLLLTGGQHAWLGHAGARRLLSPWVAREAVASAEADTGPYDVIDCPAPEAAWMARPGRTVVARSHGLDHLQHHARGDARAWLSPRLHWEALGFRRATAGIVINPPEKEFVNARGWRPPAGVHVVHHGVSSAWLDDPPPPDAPRGAGFLFCGTWDPIKGSAVLARAYALSAARGAAMPLTILGPSVYDTAADCDRFVRGFFPAACQPLLTVLPRADEGEMRRQMRRHDALLSPSLSDGCSLAQIEALSQRLPVICSRLGAAPYLWEEEAALQVAAGDAEALASAMDRLWTDGALRRQLAEAGWRRVQGMSWRATAAATLDVYRLALQKKEAPRAGAS